MTAQISVRDDLGTEQDCVELVERLRWPEGIRCIHCGLTRVFKFRVKSTVRQVKRKGAEGELASVPSRHLYECVESGHQFTLTTGTLLHDTHLPLSKWLFAIAVMINANGAVTARQMQHALGVSYKTAWYLCHRLREVFEDQEVDH